MKKKIILASASPRRIEMLEKHGFDIAVRPSKIEEIVDHSLEMGEIVKSLAYQKADAVLNDLKTNEPQLLKEYDLLIAADTIVYKDEIMGKPHSKGHGMSMLMKLKNTSHYVATGVAVYHIDKMQWDIFFDTTEVFFTDYSQEEISSYLDTDEAYDKAGGYAIQGTFGKYIDHYTGSYNNVVGFPIEMILERI